MHQILAKCKRMGIFYSGVRVSLFLKPSSMSLTFFFFCFFSLLLKQSVFVFKSLEVQSQLFNSSFDSFATSRAVISMFLIAIVEKLMHAPNVMLRGGLRLLLRVGTLHLFVPLNRIFGVETQLLLRETKMKECTRAYKKTSL